MWVKRPLLQIIVLLCGSPVMSQQVGVNINNESLQLKVNVQQAFNFGVFAQGATGGTISILPNASRAASGSVIPLNMGGLYSPLILEIEGAKGTVISLLAGQTTILTGSNGGIMKLKLLDINNSMPFIITNEAPAKNLVTIGAELIVGNMSESPPGNYSGSLYLSFLTD
ncbi:MAG: DUF4402 domain-containing protein [Niastella sp.]|nr:DUF4402 domain-containing protein [Niastella sp.]